MKKAWIWFRRLKWYWQALLIILLLGFVVNILSPSETQKRKVAEPPRETTRPAKKTEASGESKPAIPMNEEKISEPQPVELTGSGQQATQKFPLEVGLTVFSMTHSGKSNFAVWLLDNSGQRVALLANEVGGFNGAKAVGIANKGEHILDVSADGPWTVKIEQPRRIAGESKPKSFSGVGQSVSPFIRLSGGLTVFRLKHTGKSNFAVWLLDRNGQQVELLVNEIGNFDGSKPVGISRPGIYLMDISADGDWSISVE